MELCWYVVTLWLHALVVYDTLAASGLCVEIGTPVAFWARAEASRMFLVLPDDVPAHPYAVAMETVRLAPKAEVSIYP